MKSTRDRIANLERVTAAPEIARYLFMGCEECDAALRQFFETVAAALPADLSDADRDRVALHSPEVVDECHRVLLAGCPHVETRV